MILAICKFPLVDTGAICYVGRSRTELSVKLLAEALGVDATCVSRSVSCVESRIVQHKAMKQDVDRGVKV